VGDISLNGCYLETSRPNYTGDRVKLWIRIGYSELEALGVVRGHYPRIAMGIEFTFLSNADRRTLERLIAGLGHDARLSVGQSVRQAGPSDRG
jgi:hypothetical protein